MKQFIELLMNHFQKGLPFVAYRFPNTSNIKVMLQNNANWNDWNEQEGFVVVDFFWKKPFYFPIQDCESFEFASEFSLMENDYPDFEEKDADQKTFEQLVKTTIEEIHLGLLEKVVISRKIDIKQNADFGLVLHRLFQRFPSACTYVYFHPKIGCWLGATPEILVQNNQKKYQTVALAGTIYENKNQQLEFTEKESVEQQLVADYYHQILSEDVLQLNVSAPKVVQAANLKHLKSEVTFEVKPSVSTMDVLKKIHPTPAVGGSPKKAALQWISENENYQREFYSGFLGEYSKNQSHLFVQLRCMEWKEDVQTLFVGCGITKDSNPTKEFIETHEKAKTMYQLLVDCN